MKYKKQSIFLFAILLFLLNLCLFNSNLTVFAAKDSNISHNVDDVEFGIGNNGIEMKDGTGANKTTKDRDTTWNIFMEKYKVVILGISGGATLTLLLLWIVQFLKLGTLAGNPMSRQKAITSLFLTGIATGLLGSVSLFVALFYFMFR